MAQAALIIDNRDRDIEDPRYYVAMSPTPATDEDGRRALRFINREPLRNSDWIRHLASQCDHEAKALKAARGER